MSVNLKLNQSSTEGMSNTVEPKKEVFSAGLPATAPSSNFGREFNVVLDADELPFDHPDHNNASYTQCLFHSLFSEPKEKAPPSMAERILVKGDMVFDPSTGKIELLSSVPNGVKITVMEEEMPEDDFFFDSGSDKKESENPNLNEKT